MRDMQKMKYKILSFFTAVMLFLSVIAIILMKRIFADETIIRPKVEYNAGMFKDPFKRFKKTQGRKIEPTSEPKAAAEPLPVLIVQGIVWGGHTAQAIINNKVFKVGDRIENVEIIGITKNGVDVVFDDQEYNLPAPVNNTQGVRNN